MSKVKKSKGKSKTYARKSRSSGPSPIEAAREFIQQYALAGVAGVIVILASAGAILWAGGYVGTIVPPPATELLNAPQYETGKRLADLAATYITDQLGGKAYTFERGARKQYYTDRVSDGLTVIENGLYERPDDFDRNFTEQWRVQALRLAQRIPELGIPSQMRGVVDLYDVSDDWIPIYDKSSVPGYYMAIGTSGNQFKNAGVAGVMMAELIEAVEGGRDHDRDPLSFRMRHTGRDIDVGFFSRKRPINKDSSFSVLG